ncbi:hypothetical protein CF15_06635 [Pyrodictium occultum]|uniref:Amidohydrolase-related domain-containing protein n=1 Tax=Pyrodictium occultum TaxID=2309 RepID=A0A0V8RWH3_PYROC|nr:hypothetical protein [Pyrodictium occultum]KSW12400.1 hypothetical protein CF15_06635 [Pyrodictium occultum]
MPLRILFHDIYYFDEDGVAHGPGYIRLSGGGVDGIGEGEPPEEMQAAELVAGGPGRIVYPGFASPPVYLELYPFRSQLDGVEPREYPWSSVASRVAQLGEREAYYAALMAAYDLALHGYTRVIAIDPHLEAVARAIIDSGLEGAVLYPQGCSLTPRRSFEEALRGLEARGIDRSKVRVGVALCGPEPPEGVPEKAEVVYRMDNGVLEAPGAGQLRLEPLYPHEASPWSLMSRGRLDAYKTLAKGIHGVLDPGYRVYGAPAHLVVVDASEPPGWLPEPRAARPWSLTASRPRVETVVSGGRLVVDGGEHLLIGADAALKASEALRRVVGVGAV